MQDLFSSQILTQLGIYAGTLVICTASGFFPIVNTEVFLILLSTQVGKGEVVPVILLAALGQMVAKGIKYWGGRGVLKLTGKRSQEKIDKMVVKMEKWGNKIDLLIFLSASVGIPPFYFTSIAAGVMKISFVRFCIAGLTGRVIRFALFVIFPKLVQSWIG